MTVHIVKRGETLSSIAKSYSTTLDRLASENSIRDINRLSVGQSLNIPAQRQYGAPDATLKAVDESKKPTTTSTTDLSQRIGNVLYQQLGIWHGVLDALLQRFRTVEANESVQQAENATLTKQTKTPTATKEAPKNKHSQSNKSLCEVKQKLKEQLGKEPHVVTFSGVKLTDNEKKQIMAAVAVCEMNKDGFGSINADQEFVGRKFGHRGIETGYSRIVHIGLSYGFIQYTQDGGSLGELLTAMNVKNRTKFVEIFGGGNAEIADNLVALTTKGRADLVGDITIPISGHAYWNKIRKTEEGRDRKELSLLDANDDKKSDLPVSKEIRGKRVQPIKASIQDPPTDIWTGKWRVRFLDAGQVPDFQEVQIELAVKSYLNPVLGFAKENNIRTAAGLAFITACSVRYGPSATNLDIFIKSALQKNKKIPFEKGEDELTALNAIADGNGKVGEIKFDPDESRRAKLLLKDDLGFLSEDFYDVSSY